MNEAATTLANPPVKMRTSASPRYLPARLMLLHTDTCAGMARTGRNRCPGQKPASIGAASGQRRRDSAAASRDPARALRTGNSFLAKSFNKAWSEYQKMPPAVQHNTARTVATDPAFADQLRKKLASGSPQEIGQGLKMLVALPSVAAFRKELIAAIVRIPEIPYRGDGGAAHRPPGRSETEGSAGSGNAACRPAGARLMPIESMEESAHCRSLAAGADRC